MLKDQKRTYAQMVNFRLVSTADNVVEMLKLHEWTTAEWISPSRVEQPLYSTVAGRND